MKTQRRSKKQSTVQRQPWVLEVWNDLTDDCEAMVIIGATDEADVLLQAATMEVADVIMRPGNICEVRPFYDNLDDDVLAEYLEPWVDDMCHLLPKIAITEEQGRFEAECNRIAVDPETWAKRLNAWWTLPLEEDDDAWPLIDPCAQGIDD